MLHQPANKANQHARKLVKTVLSHTCQKHEQTRFLATKCVFRNWKANVADCIFPTVTRVGQKAYE